MRDAKLKLIFWETTRACNMGCPHCRADAESSRSRDELSTGEAKRFIDDAASFSAPVLVFSGGEGLLREDLYELSRYASYRGLRPALATNATLITEDVASRLKNSGINIAAVSIYGSTLESHDGFCGKPGAFSSTVKGIGNLKKYGIELQINATITRKNLRELEAIGEFAARVGASAYHVFFLVPTGRGARIEGDKISGEECEDAFKVLYGLRHSIPIRVKATCGPHYYRVLRQHTGEFSDLTKGCLAGQGVCFISYRGEVFGCGYLPVAAGDLRKDNFRDIWFGSELFRTLRDESNLQGKCGVCEFKAVCGGCRARAFTATGNYLEEEPDCVYQPLNAR